MATVDPIRRENVTPRCNVVVYAASTPGHQGRRVRRVSDHGVSRPVSTPRTSRGLFPDRGILLVGCAGCNRVKWARRVCNCPILTQDPRLSLYVRCHKGLRWSTTMALSPPSTPRLRRVVPSVEVVVVSSAQYTVRQQELKSAKSASKSSSGPYGPPSRSLKEPVGTENVSPGSHEEPGRAVMVRNLESRKT